MATARSATSPAPTFEDYPWACRRCGSRARQRFTYRDLPDGSVHITQRCYDCGERHHVTRFTIGRVAEEAPAVASSATEGPRPPRVGGARQNGRRAGQRDGGAKAGANTLPFG